MEARGEGNGRIFQTAVTGDHHDEPQGQMSVQHVKVLREGTDTAIKSAPNPLEFLRLPVCFKIRNVRVAFRKLWSAFTIFIT